MAFSTRHRLSDWGLLGALTILWGSAFLLTKVAVDAIPSQLVVAGRLVVASLVLIPLALFLAGRPSGGRRLWIFLVLIALFGNAIPFTLITWGQAYIDSGLAGILMAVMPLFTLSLSHYAVPGERLTPYRVVGFGMGFAGVVLIMGPASLLSIFDGDGPLLPLLAVLGGAFCYAIAAVLSRLRPPSDAVTTAASTTVMATFMVAAVVGLADPVDPPVTAAPPIIAIVLLGVFSTALAAVLYFRLIKTAGPAFVSQLNYLIPLWAVAIGVLFLGERPEAVHLAALFLILCGVLVSQFETANAGQGEQRRGGVRSTA